MREPEPPRSNRKRKPSSALPAATRVALRDKFFHGNKKWNSRNMTRTDRKVKKIGSRKCIGKRAFLLRGALGFSFALFGIPGLGEFYFSATSSASAAPFPSLAWEELVSSGPAPSPRRGVAGVYDGENERLVFQGAETPSAQFLPEVWFFDLENNTWSQFSGPGPDARCHHTFVVDRDRGRALLFGGFPRTNKLWSWNRLDNAWTDITPASGNPSPRCLHASVMCPSREEMIIYGGLLGGFSPDLPDTWSYDLVADSWTLLVEDSPPGRRYGHVLALDKAHDRLILFGGFWRRPDNSGSEDVNDLWTFDFAEKTWSETTP